MRRTKKTNSGINTLLIDGSFLLKFVYGDYERNDNKKSTTYRFITSIRKILKDFPHINKCVVFFDGEMSGKRRYNIYSDYKANRKHKSWYNKIKLTEKEIKRMKDEKFDLLYHKKNIQNYLEEFYIRQLEIDEIEADDLIAQYCKSFHETENIIIFTNDRDMCQLIKYDTVNIVLANKFVKTFHSINERELFNKTYILINKNNYRKHFDIHYENITLMKILEGDSSDNVKGIRLITKNNLTSLFSKIKTEKVTYEDILRIINKNYTNNTKQDIFNLKYFLTTDFYETINDIYLTIEEKRNNKEKYLSFKTPNKLKNLVCDITDEILETNKIIKKMFTDDIEISISEYLKKIKYNIDDPIFSKILEILKEQQLITIGMDRYYINEKIMNLFNPLLEKNEIDNVIEVGKLPLDYYEENKNGDKVPIRGGKHLIKLMKKDYFLNNFYSNTENRNLNIIKGNKDDFINKYLLYVNPFIKIPQQEQNYFNQLLNF